jgi:hypothetical protein
MLDHIRLMLMLSSATSPYCRIIKVLRAAQFAYEEFNVLNHFFVSPHNLSFGILKSLLTFNSNTSVVIANHSAQLLTFS